MSNKTIFIEDEDKNILYPYTLANAVFTDQGENIEDKINALEEVIETDLEGLLNQAKTYTDTKISSVLDAAPETLDTLNELAAALGDDPNFATTVSTQIGNKADKTYVDTELAKKADTHTHPYAASSHTHDDRYYTESEINTKLSAKADTHTHPYAASSHSHDERYYTESEINTKLNTKANTSHGNHVPAVQTASNSKFLRNDNTWQTVTPANIGAAASSHTHAYASSSHTHTKDSVGLGNVPNYAASSSVTSTSNTTLATSGAVKIAYDTAVSAMSAGGSKLHTTDIRTLEYNDTYTKSGSGALHATSITSGKCNVTVTIDGVSRNLYVETSKECVFYYKTSITIKNTHSEWVDNHGNGYYVTNDIRIINHLYY